MDNRQFLFHGGCRRRCAGVDVKLSLVNECFHLRKFVGVVRRGSVTFRLAPIPVARRDGSARISCGHFLSELVSNLSMIQLKCAPAREHRSDRAKLLSGHNLRGWRRDRGLRALSRATGGDSPPAAFRRSSPSEPGDWPVGCRHSSVSDLAKNQEADGCGFGRQQASAEFLAVGRL